MDKVIALALALVFTSASAVMAVRLWQQDSARLEKQACCIKSKISAGIERRDIRTTREGCEVIQRP